MIIEDESIPSYLYWPNARPIITTVKNIINPIKRPLKHEEITSPLETPTLLQLRFSNLVTIKYIIIGVTISPYSPSNLAKLSSVP